MKGDLAHRIHELHQRYGSVIRIAPNELSFIDGVAWHDIYGHHQGRPNLPKNPLWMGPADNGVHSILSANDADHARYRRLLAHAFSEKALRQQEHLLQSHITLLIRKLASFAEGPDTQAIDLVRWLNFTTFDIVGDLALGESFHCLEEGEYHRWVSIIFTQFKAATFLVPLRLFGLGKPLRRLLPKRLLEARAEHARTGNAKIQRRLDKGASVDGQRNDFMTYVQRYNDEKGMSVPEIKVTMRVIVAAGSETTATTLSGIMRYLLQNKNVMEKLEGEVRQAFHNPSEICTDKVMPLQYLGAVIEEGLRLCSPVALGMPRIVPGNGVHISGHWIPGGTHVSASGFASNRATLNFPDNPVVFNPSRWISDIPTQDRDKGTGSSKSPFNPFSLGPRNCLGRNLAYLEMRLILAHLLWAFDFESEGPISKWEEQKTWILWEKTPLPVKIRQRTPG